MAEFTVKAAKTLPWAFRPSDDRELPEYRDRDVLVRGNHPGIVLGAFRHERRGVLLFVRLEQGTGWFHLGDVEELDPS